MRLRFFFFFQAEDGIRDLTVTGVQTCALPIYEKEIAAGLALLLIVLYDIFQSVVLPRPAINKLATVRYLVRGIYWVWRWGGNRMGAIPPRERWVGAPRPGAAPPNFSPPGPGPGVG